MLLERIASLPPEEKREAEFLLESLYGQPLYNFINEWFSHQPVLKHVEPLIRKIQESQWREVRCLVSMPPRFTKTVTFLRAVAWWLKLNPADTCGYFSYSEKQGYSKSRIARDYVEATGTSLRQDAKNLGEWRTPQGGGLLAGGAGGGLTGQGISGLMIVDDPHKNRKEANIKRSRDVIYEWFNSVIYTRLELASVFVVATRWHQDDLIGRLIKDHGDDWEVINLAALAEESDPLGREPGESLWPQMFPRNRLVGIKKQIGDWEFASLYQGNPRPRSGKIFEHPVFYKWPDLDNSVVLISCDPAATSSTRADHSAVIVGAVKLTADKLVAIDIIEVHRLQVEIPALVSFLEKLQHKWQSPVVIEAVGGFKAVPQSLRAINRKIKIIEVYPTTDKYVRALPVSAAVADGRVRVRQGAEWVNNFTSELEQFTGVNDAEDDQVDALAHMYNAAVKMFATRVKRGPVASVGMPIG